MRIISAKAITDFCRKHAAATPAMVAWRRQVEQVNWTCFADVKRTFNSADAIGDSRLIFDVGGNTYRIVARVAYAPHYRLMIKFIGTHAEYSKIDAEGVDDYGKR